MPLIQLIAQNNIQILVVASKPTWNRKKQCLDDNKKSVKQGKILPVWIKRRCSSDF